MSPHKQIWPGPAGAPRFGGIRAFPIVPSWIDAGLASPVILCRGAPRTPWPQAGCVGGAKIDVRLAKFDGRAANPAIPARPAPLVRHISGKKGIGIIGFCWLLWAFSGF